MLDSKEVETAMLYALVTAGLAILGIGIAIGYFLLR